MELCRRRGAVNSIRVGSSFSIFSNATFGSELSVLDYLQPGSDLALRGTHKGCSAVPSVFRFIGPSVFRFFPSALPR